MIYCFFASQSFMYMHIFCKIDVNKGFYSCSTLIAVIQCDLPQIQCEAKQIRIFISMVYSVYDM